MAILIINNLTVIVEYSSSDASSGSGFLAPSTNAAIAKPGEVSWRIWETINGPVGPFTPIQMADNFQYVIAVTPTPIT